MSVIQSTNAVPNLYNNALLNPSEEVHQSILLLKNKSDFYASNLEISFKIALIAQVGVTILGLCNLFMSLMIPSPTSSLISSGTIILSVILVATIIAILKTIWRLPQSMDATLQTIIKETSVEPGLQILRKADKHSFNSLKEVREKANTIKKEVNLYRKLFHLLNSICLMQEDQVSSHLATLEVYKNLPTHNKNTVSPLLTKIMDINAVPVLSVFSEKQHDYQVVNTATESLTDTTHRSSFTNSFSITYKEALQSSQWNEAQNYLSKKTSQAFLLSLFIACLSTAFLVISILANQWFMLTFSIAIILITFGVMLSLGLPLKNQLSGVILSNEIQESLVQHIKMSIDNNSSQLQDLTNKQITVLERRRIQLNVIPTETQLYEQEIGILKKQIVELEKVISENEKKGLAKKKLLLWEQIKSDLHNQTLEEETASTLPEKLLLRQLPRTNFDKTSQTKRRNSVG